MNSVWLYICAGSVRVLNCFMSNYDQFVEVSYISSRYLQRNSSYLKNKVIWWVILRIYKKMYVASAIFQLYRDLVAGKNIVGFIHSCLEWRTVKGSERIYQIFVLVMKQSGNIFYQARHSKNYIAINWLTNGWDDFVALWSWIKVHSSLFIIRAE